MTGSVQISVPPHDPSVLYGGDVVADKYLLVEPIGAGGMGQVWLARNLSTGAEVAAKVLLPSRLTAYGGVERFRREAQTTAKLSHRAIVRMFDLIELDPARGSLVMVMELLRGKTLAQRLEELGPIPVDQTLAIVLPILSALSHSHGLGVVHRDLKPDNILLAIDPDGHVMPKILDFGISKIVRDGAGPITGAGEIVGTLCYMSPEQARGDDVDARSDVFSVGILLYECLAGRNPFVGTGPSTLESMMRALFASQPQPIEWLPPALWEAIRRALSVEAGDRFPTADALADALREAVPSLIEQPLDPRASVPAPVSRVVIAAGGAARMEAVTSAFHPVRRRYGAAAAAVGTACVALALTSASCGTLGATGSRPVPVRIAGSKHAAVSVDALLPGLPPGPHAAAAASAAKRAPSRGIALSPGF